MKTYSKGGGRAPAMPQPQPAQPAPPPPVDNEKAKSAAAEAKSRELRRRGQMGAAGRSLAGSAEGSMGAAPISRPQLSNTLGG